MIYVDNFYVRCEYRGMRMSHLFGANEEALHRFAAKLGLRRSWFHRDHYDISFSKRELALVFGAIPVHYRVMARMVQFHRRTGGTIVLRTTYDKRPQI